MSIDDDDDDAVDAKRRHVHVAVFVCMCVPLYIAECRKCRKEMQAPAQQTKPLTPLLRSSRVASSLYTSTTITSEQIRVVDVVGVVVVVDDVRRIVCSRYTYHTHCLMADQIYSMVSTCVFGLKQAE